MGAQSSSTAERVHLKEKQNDRPYRLPSVRQKDRFNYSEASHFDDNDGSTDKVYIMCQLIDLLFPILNPKHILWLAFISIV